MRCNVSPTSRLRSARLHKLLAGYRDCGAQGLAPTFKQKIAGSFSYSAKLCERIDGCYPKAINRNAQERFEIHISPARTSCNLLATQFGPVRLLVVPFYSAFSGVRATVFWISG